ADYWGGVRPALLPAADFDDLELGQISNTLIDTQIELVVQQDPDIVADETKSIVVVRLIQQTATGATVTFEPTPPPSSSYGVSDEHKPVLDSNVINSSILPFWVAF